MGKYLRVRSGMCVYMRVCIRAGMYAGIPVGARVYVCSIHSVPTIYSCIYMYIAIRSER